MTYLPYFPYLCYVIIVLFSVRRIPCDNTVFSLEKSNYIRGICAAHIVLGHLSMRSTLEILSLFEKTMICSVGMFFCLSGYGLMSSYKKSRSIFFFNWKMRYIKIVIPVLLAACFTLIMFNDNTTVELLFNWYIVELMVLYIGFYSCFYFFKGRQAIKNLFLLTIFIMIILYVNHFHKSWYIDTLCFPMGVFIKDKEKNILKIVDNNYYLLLGGAITILGLMSTSIFMKDIPFVLEVFTRILSAASFCWIALLLVNRLGFKSKFLHGIGLISFELYLYHIPLVSLLYPIYNNYGFFVYEVAVIFFALVVSIIMHSIDVKIIASIYRKVS